MAGKRWAWMALLLMLATSANGCFCRNRPGLFARFRGQAPTQPCQPCSDPCSPCPCGVGGDMPMLPGGSPLLLTPPGVSEGFPGVAPNGTAQPLPAPPLGTPSDQAKPAPAGPSSPMKSVRVAQPNYLPPAW